MHKSDHQRGFAGPGGLDLGRLKTIVIGGSDRESRCDEHHRAPRSHTEANDPSDPRAHRNGLLQQNEDSQADDPKQIHDAAEKQQPHQKPAAPQAIAAMLKPHSEGAQPTWSPALDEETNWRSAMAQADCLNRLRKNP